jgi:pantoate--beta-alanine ligase
MKVFSKISEFREARKALGADLGFVPTMGAFHEGHVALLQRSVAECRQTVLSIYVNSTQFNNPVDLTNYPITMKEDLCRAQQIGVDVVLTPSYEEVYSDDFRYQVHEKAFSRELCGPYREGHFAGVLTVVMKLLNLVRPRRAFFGEKDYQQYLLIRDMCEAFFMDVEIVPCPTVREADGLAMSSRNALLDIPGRARAAQLHELISTPCSDSVVAGALQRAGFAVDYVTTRQDRRFAAATLRCGERDVRLIDNVPTRTDQH